MNKEFAVLVSELYNPSSDGFRVADSMKLVDGHQAILLDELNREIERDDSRKILFLLWTISFCPSPIFTPTLCALLENKQGHYYLEAAVEAMHEVADERSVPCLRQALGREEPWEQDFEFRRKILWALERIGTPEAIDAVRSALQNEHSRIRETVEEILVRDMKKKACEKIANALLPYLPRYVYHSRSNAILQVPVGSVFRGMIFDSSGLSSDAFYPHVFVLPLYVPTDHFTLSFGRRLPGNWVHVAGDEEVLAGQLAEALEQEDALKFLDDLSTADDLANNLPTHFSNQRDPYFQQAIAYSEFMCGRFDAGLRWLDECLQTIHEMQRAHPEITWYAAIVRELSTLRDLVLSDTRAAGEQLNAWTEYTRGRLRLPA